MADATATTGIRVKVVPPHYSRFMDGLLHFLPHYEELNKTIFQASHLKYELDGEATTIDATLEHVFPCAPGAHELELALLPPINNPLAEINVKVSMKVTVPEGTTITVLYKIRPFGNPLPGGYADIELAPE